MQVAITYRVESPDPQPFPDAHPYPLPAPSTEFDILLELTERPATAGPGSLTGTLIYPDQLFDRPTIARLATTMRDQLATLQAECEHGEKSVVVTVDIPDSRV